MNLRVNRRIDHLSFRTHAVIVLSLLLCFIVMSIVPDMWLVSQFSILLAFIVPGFSFLLIFRNLNINAIEKLVVAFSLSMIVNIVIQISLIKLRIINDGFALLALSIIVICALIIAWLRKKPCTFIGLGCEDGSKDYYLLLIVSLILVKIIALSIIVGDATYIHTPDESGDYFNQARNMFLQTNVGGDLGWSSPSGFWARDILPIIYSFVFTFSGISAQSAAIASIFLSAMLIPITFLIGSLISKRTGLVAAAFMAFNPIIWWASPRLWPDIAAGLFIMVFIYFFIRLLNGENNRSTRTIFIIICLSSFIFAFFTKPTLAIIIPSTVLFFFLTFFSKKELINQLGLRRIFLICFVTIVSLVIVYMQFLSGAYPFWELPAHFSQSDWTNYSNLLYKFVYTLFQFRPPEVSSLSAFVSYYSGGMAYSSLLSPLFYTLPVLVLTIIGILQSEKFGLRLNILFLSSILLYFVAAGVLQLGEIRHGFFLFPFIFVYAANGILEINKFRNLPVAIALLILAIIIPVGWLIEPYHIILDPSLVPSNFSTIMWFLSQAITVIILLTPILLIIREKSISGNWIRLFAIFNKRKHHIKRLPKSLGLFCIITLILSLNAAYAQAYCYFGNWNYWRENDGMDVVSNWFINNTPEGVTIMTNNPDARFYMGNRTIVMPPRDGYGFEDMMWNHKIDYLLLFTDSLSFPLSWAPFTWLNSYLVKGPIVSKLVNSSFIVVDSMESLRYDSGQKLSVVYEIGDQAVNKVEKYPENDSWVLEVGDYSGKTVFLSTDAIEGDYSVKAVGVQNWVNKHILFNATSYDYFHFSIKSSQNDAGRVAFRDNLLSNSERIPFEVSTNWVEVLIPLSSFGTAIDLSNLTVVFWEAFKENTDIYLDDITFIKLSR